MDAVLTPDWPAVAEEFLAHDRDREEAARWGAFLDHALSVQDIADQFRDRILASFGVPPDLYRGSTCPPQPPAPFPRPAGSVPAPPATTALAPPSPPGSRA